MNRVIDLIRSRVSCPKLGGLAPNKEELEAILSCAVRAPDHARLKPWHFHVVQGDALVRLGNVFANEAEADGCGAVDKLTKCRNMPLRAPMMIVAVCEPALNSKVPIEEQVLAVGAAIQNMQIAISSLDYGSIWRTGVMAESAQVKEAFGLSAQGSIVGFVYVGQPEKRPAQQKPNLEDYYSNW
jgi:nitroreductase